MKIITDEEAECAYSETTCTYLFEDGIKMSTVNDREHYSDWNSEKTFYIRCRDEYNNQPAPNECNIIVRPFELFGE